MKYLRWILITVLILAAVWRLAPHLTDFQEFINLANNINWAWITLAVFAQISQYVGDGWLSQLVLKIIGIRINFIKTLQIASIDVFAAHLLPIGEAGVIATTYYFYKKLGVDNQSIIFLSIAWSLATGISLALMLLLSALLLPKIPNFSIHIPQITAYLTATAFTLIAVILATRNYSIPKINKFLKKLSFYKEITTFTSNISSHKEALLKNKNLVVCSLFAGFIYYAGNILTLSFSFLAFGKIPPISVVAFTYFISLIAGWITLAPGGLGASEASMLIIFHQFGVEPALSIAATLTFRVISFWLPIPAGALSYFSLKRDSKTV